MVFNRSKPDPAAPQAPAAPQPKRAEPAPMNTVAPGPGVATPRIADSVIGSDLTIEGQQITIRCKGSLRVNGKIQADVHSMQLVVGEEAVVTGQVAADAVNVFGRVNGAILGARVVLHSSAVVEGDIHSEVLGIEQGAAFDGRSRKVKDPREIAPQLESPNSAHANGTAPPPLGTGSHRNIY